jgi:hypothetical protein
VAKVNWNRSKKAVSLLQTDCNILRYSAMSTPKVSRWFDFFAVLAFVVVIIACRKEDEEKIFPYLRVVNQIAYEIIGVICLDYSYTGLNIEDGEEKTFSLIDGMSDGYENISVIVIYRISISQIYDVTKEVNFKDGDTTTVTLKKIGGDIVLE